MLICLQINSTHTLEGRDAIKSIGRTLDKPKGFLVHLSSSVNYLGGNLENLFKTIAQ